MRVIVLATMSSSMKCAALISLLGLNACAAHPEAASAPAASAAPAWATERVALPGAAPPVSLDFLFFEAARSRVWVPAGGTGAVDVLDVKTRAFTRVSGFKTVEREAHGHKRVLGPSSGAVGEGYAYVGNRGSSEVCAVELSKLELGACVELRSAPDGIAYVQSTRELWVTTPDMQDIVVFDADDAGGLKTKASIALPGDPECYAVDEAHGIFLTNLEDKGTTVSIDLKTHAVLATWATGCASDGPRGIAVDSARRLALVACTDHVQVLDLAHGGALLGKVDTGPGLDNLDFEPKTGLVYAAAGKAARLTVAQLGDHGELNVVATVSTANGARNAVVDGSGVAYLADGPDAQLLIVRPKTK